MKIINFKKKKMKLLTKMQQQLQKHAILTKEILKKNILKLKNIVKLEVIFIIQGGHRIAAHSICNLK